MMNGEYLSWAHGDGDTIVHSGPCYLIGVLINSTLTGSFALRDGTTAAGTLLFTTATNAAALVQYDMPAPIYCRDGLFIDDAATGGNALVFYREA
jgi:hypothetical protein